MSPDEVDGLLALITIGFWVSFFMFCSSLIKWVSDPEDNNDKKDDL